MSINFHANQYEQAFAARRLQNWEIPKSAEGKYPRALTGFTRIKANDRGHLLPNIPKNRSSPWGTFVGTWDMPKHIPGNQVLNPTARSEDAWLKNKKAKEDCDVILSGALKTRHTVEPLLVKMDTLEDEQKDKLDPCFAVQPPSGPDCLQEKTTHCKPSQHRETVTPEKHECLKWPRTKIPSCKSPIEFATTPKPVKTMNAANVISKGEGGQQCPAMESYN